MQCQYEGDNFNRSGCCWWRSNYYYCPSPLLCWHIYIMKIYQKPGMCADSMIYWTRGNVKRFAKFCKQKPLRLYNVIHQKTPFRCRWTRQFPFLALYVDTLIANYFLWTAQQPRLKVPTAIANHLITTHSAADQSSAQAEEVLWRSCIEFLLSVADPSIRPTTGCSADGRVNYKQLQSEKLDSDMDCDRVKHNNHVP